MTIYRKSEMELRGHAQGGPRPTSTVVFLGKMFLLTAAFLVPVKFLAEYFFPYNPFDGPSYALDWLRWPDLLIFFTFGGIAQIPGLHWLFALIPDNRWVGLGLICVMEAGVVAVFGVIVRSAAGFIRRAKHC